MDARAYPRTLRPPSESFFLFGIRGVGKSTWAARRFPTAPRIDLLDEGAFQACLRDPRGFGLELRRHRRGTWVVVDEVQRLPSLLNEVHRAIEEVRPRHRARDEAPAPRARCGRARSAPRRVDSRAPARAPRLRRLVRRAHILGAHTGRHRGRLPDPAGQVFRRSRGEDDGESSVTRFRGPQSHRRSHWCQAACTRSHGWTSVRHAGGDRGSWPKSRQERRSA